VSVERSQLCDDCGSPLAHDQGYCLCCGARVGPRSPQLEVLLSRVRGRLRAEYGAPARSVPAGLAGILAPAGRTDAVGAATPAGPAAPTGSEPWVGVSAPTARATGGLRLPSPRVSLLLVLVFAGFGVLLGDVAGSRQGDTLAAVRSPLRLVLPPSSSSGAGSATTASESAASASGNEPPSSEPETTPEPAATTTSAAATSTAKASKPASSGTGSGSKGGSSGAGGGSSKTKAGAPAKQLPAIKHVFVIMLADEPYSAAFGPSSAAPYLAQTLEHKGELLTHYDAITHDGLADELALLSGQGATVETAANCPNYTEITATGTGPDEQVLGSGCVYPASTPTLLGQLTAKHLTWRAYVEGIDEGGAQGACAHPALGQVDSTAAEAASSGPYATFRNPFVYFASVVNSSQCAADDVGLNKLQSDLASASSTPSFSYLVPGRCHDGNPTPCSPGAPAGMASAETFLKQAVPEIMASKAYKEGGLLVITVDQAPSTGEFADSSSCCGQPLFPNDPAKNALGAPRGGGAVGALLLSPYVKGAITVQEPYNHFSLLRTIEDLFGLQHLGYAGLSAVKSFEPSMFTAGKG
jgi:hypothetical protein